jgi:hypothetical protein
VSTSESNGEVRRAALEVLSDVLEWLMPLTRWDQVAERVAAMERAVAADDLAALDDAVMELELAAPVRITPVGGGCPEKVPVTKDVRERVNRLQHTLVDNPREALDDEEGRTGDRPDRGR